MDAAFAPFGGFATAGASATDASLTVSSLGEDFAGFGFVASAGAGFVVRRRGVRRLRGAGFVVGGAAASYRVLLRLRRAGRVSTSPVGSRLLGGGLLGARGRGRLAASAPVPSTGATSAKAANVSVTNVLPANVLAVRVGSMFLLPLLHSQRSYDY